MLRFVPNPNVPIPTHERRYGYQFEVTPIRAYDSPDWIEDMETYLDIEPAVPSEIEGPRSRKIPPAMEEAANLLEATDYDTKYQYIDRVIGRTVLPSLSASEKARFAPSLQKRAERKPTFEGFLADPEPATSKTNTYLLLGALAIGGYMLYKALDHDSGEIPARKLPRYAGGKRRL
jgi:hypothetical protein